MPWRSQGVIALVIAVASNSALAQQESSAWPSRPQVVLAPSTYTQIYQATCPAGQGPQWGYLAYDSITPGDSTLRFRARVAKTQADLTTATWTTLATLPPDPDSCPVSGPAPCPKSLYNTFGATQAKYPFLELEITLTPTTDKQFGPTVNSWNVAYSCPFNQ